MKAITLRNIPPQLGRRLQEEAEISSSSLNKTVIRLLLKATGLGGAKRAPTRYHDLDHLAGTWSPEESAEFDRVLAEQRRIDEKLWE